MDNLNETLKNNQMTKEEREQYLFGPWLSIITSKENIPIQYMTFKDIILSAELAIKVPVDKDRIELHPGMLMYKQLVLFTLEEIILLETSNHGIIKTHILLSDIQFIIRGGELLNNYILIGANDKEYKIEYYSISEELTNRMLQLVRQVFLSNNKEVESFGLDGSKLMQLPLYKYFKIKNDSDVSIKIVGYQPNTYVNLKDQNKSYIINRVKRVKIDEVMFLTNGKELIIASGDINKTTQASVDYSYRHCYIRLDCLSDITLTEEIMFEETQILTISIKGLRLSLNVKDGFDTTLLMNLIKSVNA